MTVLVIAVLVEVESSLVESSPVTMLIKERPASKIRAIIVLEITELGSRLEFCFPSPFILRLTKFTSRRKMCRIYSDSTASSFITVVCIIRGIFCWRWGYILSEFRRFHSLYDNLLLNTWTDIGVAPP